MSKTIAIYPGTFDPVTNGHLDLIKRSSHLFETLIIAVAESTRKAPLFSLEQRLAFVKTLMANYQNISICSFNGLLVDFARSKNATIILRGVRNSVDFEYEMQMANMNHIMYPALDTIFMTPHPEYANISSTQIRDILQMGGDVSSFVPDIVIKNYKQSHR